MPVTIQCNAAAIAAQLGAAVATLPMQLAAASDLIAASVMEEVGMRYGPVAKYFTSATGMLGGAASVHIGTDNQHALWWEYGTRPHPIAAVNAQALRFTSKGVTLMRRSVHHPGTRAHNQRDGCLQALALTAQIEWRAALAAALTEA